MSEKSHVAMVQRICLDCGENYDTGELALATRIINGELEKPFDRYLIVGPGLCPECFEKSQKDESIFVFVTEKDEDKEYIAQSFRVYEPLLRDILDKDLPEDYFDKRILQTDKEAARQIINICQQVMEGIKERKQADLDYEKRTQSAG